MKAKKITHEQMNRQNWRYKKNVAPKEEFPDKNGPVKIVKTASEPVKKAKYAQAAAMERSYQERLGRKLREII